MGNYTTSAAAERDLREIFRYIAREKSRTRARSFLRSLETTMQRLADSPGIGSDRSYLAPDLLGFPKGKYIIFYQKKGDDIQIVRVLHGRRDIENLF
ncbi:MAG: type II toxin-antitoxin system RelE/ParE family toxin [Bacteroidota bacterium]